MAIPWTKECETGIEVIDDHHKTIFEKMNELLSAVERGEDKATLKKRIVLFESFLLSHLALEEALQNKLDFREYTAHSNQHIQLAREFSGFGRLLDREDISRNLATIAGDFLNDWWKAYLDHLHTSDKRLAEFLKTRI